MAGNISKIYQRTAFIILVIIISGLLNICLFSFQAKAAAPKPTAPKINFADNTYYGFGEACSAGAAHEPTQTVNRPSAPMPQCCLAQNRYYNAVVNTANDQSAPTFTSLIILPLDNLNPENNFSYHTSQNLSPPPEGLALASIVIRE